MYAICVGKMSGAEVNACKMCGEGFNVCKDQFFFL